MAVQQLTATDDAMLLKEPPMFFKIDSDDEMTLINLARVRFIKILEDESDEATVTFHFSNSYGLRFSLSKKTLDELIMAAFT